MPDLSDVLTAISHPTRRAIIDRLAKGPAGFLEIARPFDTALNAVTKHLKLLEQGLAASGPSGTPISAKFEVEEGKLQLSVYTMKGTQFSEVAVDYKTGRVAKTEAITEGEDLTAAKAQAAAMAKAKQTLRAVTEQAVKANAGFRAVSVFPALTAGKPVAKLTLLKGTTFKTVTENLD